MREELLERIYKICVDWENCAVEKRMAEEILAVIEAERMIKYSNKEIIKQTRKASKDKKKLPHIANKVEINKSLVKYVLYPPRRHEEMNKILPVAKKSGMRFSTTYNKCPDVYCPENKVYFIHNKGIICFTLKEPKK